MGATDENVNASDDEAEVDHLIAGQADRPSLAAVITTGR